MPGCYGVKFRCRWNWLKIEIWDLQAPYINGMHLVSLVVGGPYPKFGWGSPWTWATLGLECFSSPLLAFGDFLAHTPPVIFRYRSISDLALESYCSNHLSQADKRFSSFTLARAKATHEYCLSSLVPGSHLCLWTQPFLQILVKLFIRDAKLSVNWFWNR